MVQWSKGYLQKKPVNGNMLTISTIKVAHAYSDSTRSSQDVLVMFVRCRDILRTFPGRSPDICAVVVSTKHVRF